MKRQVAYLSLCIGPRFEYILDREHVLKASEQTLDEQLEPLLVGHVEPLVVKLTDHFLPVEVRCLKQSSNNLATF